MLGTSISSIFHNVSYPIKVSSKSSFEPYSFQLSTNSVSTDQSKNFYSLVKSLPFVKQFPFLESAETGKALYCLSPCSPISHDVSFLFRKQSKFLSHMYVVSYIVYICFYVELVYLNFVLW